MMSAFILRSCAMVSGFCTATMMGDCLPLAVGA